MTRVISLPPYLSYLVQLQEDCNAMLNLAKSESKIVEIDVTGNSDKFSYSILYVLFKVPVKSSIPSASHLNPSHRCRLSIVTAGDSIGVANVFQQDLCRVNAETKSHKNLQENLMQKTRCLMIGNYKTQNMSTSW